MPDQCDELEHAEQADNPAVKERVRAGERLFEEGADLRSQNAAEDRAEYDAFDGSANDDLPA